MGNTRDAEFADRVLSAMRTHSAGTWKSPSSPDECTQQEQR